MSAGLTLRQHYEHAKGSKPKPVADERLDTKPVQPADPPILRHWQDRKTTVRITMLGDREGFYRGVIVYVSRFAIQFDGCYSVSMERTTAHRVVILMKHAISSIEADQYHA